MSGQNRVRGIRQPLLAEQFGWKKVQIFYGTAGTLWAGAGGALGALGLGAVAAGAFPPAAILILIAARAKYREITIEHKLNDPPRRDFEIATRARRRSFRPEALGDSPLELAAERFFMAALMADARLEASIRAEERALGARARGRVELAAEREREARQFLRDAAILQEEIETASINLSVSLAKLQPPPTTDQDADFAVRSAQTSPLSEAMPPDVLEAVRAAGMLERDLAEPIARSTTGARFAELFDTNEIRETFNTDLGIALVPVSLQSGETAQTLRSASGAAADIAGERERIERDLLEETMPSERRELLGEGSQEILPPAPEWRLDIEKDSEGHRWILRRGDGRVAGVSADRFSNRAEALEAARDFVARKPRFSVSEVSPGRFEWQARARTERTVAFGRVHFSTRADADRAVAEVQAGLSRTRIGGL